MDQLSEKLADLAAAIRESSLKRLARVPDGSENWRPTPGAMSYADIIFHLIQADQWLIKKLVKEDLIPIVGEANSCLINARSEYLKLLFELGEVGAEKVGVISRLSPQQLERTIPDSRFGGKAQVWWIIARGNLDHEAHHRGQVAVYLKICGL